MAMAVEGVFKELCAYASTQTSGNVPCLHLRGGARPFPSSLPLPPMCARRVTFLKPRVGPFLKPRPPCCLPLCLFSTCLSSSASPSVSPYAWRMILFLDFREDFSSVHVFTCLQHLEAEESAEGLECRLCAQLVKQGRSKVLHCCAGRMCMHFNAVACFQFAGPGPMYCRVESFP